MMLENTPKQPQQPAPAKPAPTNKSNEMGRFEVMDYIKIYDPQTKEVMVEKRS